MKPAFAETESETPLARTAFYITWACAASVLVSIAVSQILLALAFGAVLVSGVRLRLPRIWVPLALFMAGTVASLLLSGDMAAGRPQIRKFYVYLTLLVVYSTFRGMAQVRRLVLSWAGGARLATAAGALYLIWLWKRRLLAAVPVLLLLVLWINPVKARHVALGTKEAAIG